MKEFSLYKGSEKTTTTTKPPTPLKRLGVPERQDYKKARMLQTQSSVTKRSFQHRVSQAPRSSEEVLWIALCMLPWNETVCYWLTRIFSIITLLDCGGGRWLSPGTDGQVHGTARFCTSSVYRWFLLLSLCVFNFFLWNTLRSKELSCTKGR